MLPLFYAVGTSEYAHEHIFNIYLGTCICVRAALATAPKAGAKVQKKYETHKFFRRKLKKKLILQWKWQIFDTHKYQKHENTEGKQRDEKKAPKKKIPGKFAHMKYWSNFGPPASVK